VADPRRFQNPDGTYDGAAIVGALTGMSRDEARARFEAIKAQHARTQACLLHELVPTGEQSHRYRCTACGWEPEAGQLLAYEQGLKHGRAHASGGGRGR
jgi:hypothetical protein